MERRAMIDRLCNVFAGMLDGLYMVLCKPSEVAVTPQVHDFQLFQSKTRRGIHLYIGCFCVQRILHKLFDGSCDVQNDLPRADAVDYLLVDGCDLATCHCEGSCWDHEFMRGICRSKIAAFRPSSGTSL